MFLKRGLAAAAVLAVTGCASSPLGYQSMSPEQLTAMAKMKDASVQCIKGNTPLTGSFFRS